jgi:uracil-DNA glycosylase family 4
MLLSNLTQWYCNKLPEKEAIKMIADSGFDAYDISLFQLTREEDYLFNQPNYVEIAKEMREYADSLGIVCNQSHAPFPSSVGKEEEDKVIYEKIVRAMEIASILGAKIIVVHPKQHLIHAEHPDELFEMNVEFYKSLIPYCEKFGIKVACENMWQWYNGNKVPSDSTCSRAWEFNKYLDAIDLDRHKNIYIANIVKCRPPKNRDPLDEEQDACIGWIKEQTRLIRPKIIVSLGRVAATRLIDKDFKVTRQHGQFIEKNGFYMMGTFHPSALLRNPAQKPDAFEDFIALREKISEVCEHTY